MENTTIKIRALIVDDEPFARERVRRLLSEENDIEIVGEAGDGESAIEEIKKQKPDLLLLDVQMPGKNGFQVLENLKPEESPIVIFLTAFDQYAVRAFESAALDYLLKPFDEERFAKSVERARATFRQTRQAKERQVENPSEIETEASASLSTEEKYLERIIIRTGGRVLFRSADEIDWIEAYGNYVRLHIGEKKYLLRETLAGFEIKLDPSKFVRVHRSAIVQIARIREARKNLSGSYELILQNGEQLTMSRRFARRLPLSLENTN
ncbi:MAG: LytTR family DNA-binding domain-containing protein [Acidobacteriota bacterium]|nr:LytTR family DNA-binding domain-containing protein [Acidobacteriota bacterium]